MENLSKDEKTSVTVITEAGRPTLITINGQKSIANRRWNDAAVADYVIENASSGWMTVNELARFVYGSAKSSEFKIRVRSKLSSLFKELRARAVLLAIRYDGDNGAASEVKIADMHDADERQKVRAKLDIMRKRKEMSEDEYHKSSCLVDRLSQ